MKKIISVMTLLLIAIFCFSTLGSADSFDSVLQRWTKSRKFFDQEDKLSTVEVFATYYSAEFIEAYIQKEAKKAMWTQQETEDYKYNFLKALRLNEMIPIHIKFINNAPTMYLGPFDIFVKLKIGNKTYKPVDYDKRFNFKFQGEKEGLVYFPRYDAKTGKDLLKGVKNVTLELPSSITPISNGKEIKFMWDVYNDNPSKLYQGKSANKFETDRLLLRLDKLKKDKAGLESQLNTVNQEIDVIQKRLDELTEVTGSLL
ncbi:MAG: hypothetical protein RR272_05200 [Synergistaceae bacterium]